MSQIAGLAVESNTFIALFFLVAAIAIAAIAWQVVLVLRQVRVTLESVDNLTQQVTRDLHPTMTEATQVTARVAELLGTVDETLGATADAIESVEEGITATRKWTERALDASAGALCGFYAGVWKGLSVLRRGRKRAVNAELLAPLPVPDAPLKSLTSD